MLAKWLVFLKKQYFVLLLFLLTALLLVFLPVWQRDTQGEAMPQEEKQATVKDKKTEKRADVFLPEKEIVGLHDPFLLAKKSEAIEQSQDVLEELPKTELIARKKVSLVGILRNGAKAKALVQVGETMVSVEVGSSIEGYGVVSIGEQEVFLEGREGKLVLDFAKQ